MTSNYPLDIQVMKQTKYMDIFKSRRSFISVDVNIAFKVKVI